MFVTNAKHLTHAGAKKIADTAVGKARQAGIAISVAVADAGGHLKADFDGFCHAEADWLNDFALFMALKRVNDLRPWSGVAVKRCLLCQVAVVQKTQATEACRAGHRKYDLARHLRWLASRDPHPQSNIDIRH